MSNQDYLVLKGHYTASMATAGEAEDVLQFLPGQTDQLVLRLQYTNGAGLIELRLLPEDQQHVERIVAIIRSVALCRAAKAEKALKALQDSAMRVPAAAQYLPGQGGSTHKP